MNLSELDDERERLAALVRGVKLAHEGANRSRADWEAHGAAWQAIATADDAGLATLLPAFSVGARRKLREAAIPLVAILGALHANVASLPGNDVGA